MKLFLLLISVLFLGISPNISSASLQSSTITVDPQNIPPLVEKEPINEEISCGACTSYRYSPWGPCQSNNLQSKTLIEALPEGCTPSKDLELTRACSFCANCAVAGVCQTGGGCNVNNGQCIPVVNVPSGQDPNNQCSPYFNACSDDTKIGPDGNCDGNGACKLSGLSEHCFVAGPNQTGGGCLDGRCLAITPKIPKCGDGTCSGSESCLTCANDCGACTFCGDGIVQQPNTLGAGGLGGGYEQCDGNDGITSSPFLSNINLQYGCADKSCTFLNIIRGGGYCGDDFCQTKYENNDTCANDCTEKDYYWIYSDWSECSVECGGGTQIRVIQCFSRLEDKVVNNSYCEDRSLKKEVVEHLCNTQACDSPEPSYYWDYSDWGACSKDCGGGIKTRAVDCFSEDGSLVADSFCEASGEEKPDTQILCNTQDCDSVDDYYWFYSNWSECSAECGGGTQSRTANCFSRKIKKAVNIKYCATLKLDKDALEQSCNTHTCEPVITYSWQYINDWSVCSAECGGGTQTKVPSCVSSLGTTVDDRNCLGNKLNQAQECNTQACDSPEPSYYWQYSPWSQCDKECGGGTQIRVIQCFSRLEDKVVNNSYCEDRSLKKEVVEQSCNTQACEPVITYSVQTSSWSDCDCSVDQETRTYWCESSLGIKVDNSLCGLTPRNAPLTTQPCTLSCDDGMISPYKWIYSGWNPAECSPYTMKLTRTVQCVTNDAQEIPVDGIYCQGEKLEATIQFCFR